MTTEVKATSGVTFLVCALPAVDAPPRGHATVVRVYTGRLYERLRSTLSRPAITAVGSVQARASMCVAPSLLILREGQGEEVVTDIAGSSGKKSLKQKAF